eukprot:3502170-Amphidinium_carterae.1
MAVVFTRCYAMPSDIATGQRQFSGTLTGSLQAATVKETVLEALKWYVLTVRKTGQWERVLC